MKPSRPFLPRVLPLGLAALLGLLPALAAPYQLPRKTVDAEPAGELAESSGLRAWDATLAKETRGLQAPKLLAGRVYGLLQAEPARFPVAFPAPGADLDLGYNDFLDLDLMLPPGFAGTVAVEFAAKGIDEDEPMERIVLPLAPLAADGCHRRVRLDLGLVPRWRGFLTRAALVIEPDAASRGKPAAVGMLLVGDTPGDPPARYEELNLKPEMKLSDLLFMESNYIRFHRNLHFKEIIGIDPMPFSTLLHASYFQDHPRLIYADYSMAFDLVDGVHHHHVPWGGWYFDEFAAKLKKPRGLVASYTFGRRTSLALRTFLYVPRSGCHPPDGRLPRARWQASLDGRPHRPFPHFQCRAERRGDSQATASPPVLSGISSNPHTP